MVDLIVTLESDLYQNCRPILLESEFESLTIQFGTPNHISLVCGGGIPFPQYQDRLTVFVNYDLLCLHVNAPLFQNI